MADHVSPARKAFQTKANLFCGLGIGLQIVSNLSLRSGRSGIDGPNVAMLAVAIVIGIVSLVCWFVGLAAYAQSKGYSKILSLLGLLSCCGLLIMVLLPNKWVDAPTGGYGPGDYPRPN